jgi:VIT1/CCC1 family predicted Fe2+/Mn2+ transporter
MTDARKTTRQSVLDPIERSSEVLFGLIMVLSFTGSISAASAGREEIKTMFIGALGCNLAWGIVDAIMYILNTLGARGRELRMARHIRDAATPEAARAAIAETLPDALADSLRDGDFAAIAARVRELPAPPLNPPLRKSDFTGALGIFLLVFVSTLPVVIPFAVMTHARLALRISNWIAIGMLFFTGLSLGRWSFKRPWAVGLVMVAVGLVLVSITMALGG